MIRVHETTESTNNLALEAARSGAAHGSCWVADRQTAGRGSRQIGGDRRDWYSPAGANLYMSLLLRPELEPARATHMTLATAVGAADALVERTGADVWIKWPNDLYIGPRKLAGILTEAQVSNDQLEAVVVGLGINVNLAPDAIPDELDDEMTSLRMATDRRWDRLALMFDVRNRVEARCESFAEAGLDSVIDDVRALDRTDGWSVEVLREGGWRQGTARGVDESGHLRVELDDEVVAVRAGEVEFLEPGGG